MFRNHNLIPLSHDHQRALGTCVLVERSLQANQSPENVALHAATIVRQFESDIHEHFELEENALFPTLADFPSLSGLIAELIAEHAVIKAVVSKLQATPDIDTVVEFCRLLQTHIRKEERVLFQKAQELLSPFEMDRLGEQLTVRKATCSLKGGQVKK